MTQWEVPRTNETHSMKLVPSSQNASNEFSIQLVFINVDLPQFSVQSVTDMIQGTS